jgi:hypothetical protein
VKLTGHAQVHDQNSARTAVGASGSTVCQGPGFVNVNQNELAATPYAGNPRTLQLTIEDGRRERQNELGQPDLSGDDTSPDDGPAQGAHDVLDFRQLRHVRKFDLRSDWESNAERK